MSTAQPTPVLSVVMAVRNGEAEIAEQLDALAIQETTFPWELVVVDDGSADATRAILGRYAARLPMTVVSGPQRGCAAARNLGVHQTTSKSLLFLDHDDAVASGFLEAMRAALDVDPLAIARFDCRALNPGWVGEYRPAIQEDGPRMGLWPFGATAALGVRRSLFDELGGFDEAMSPGEDRDLCYRAGRLGLAPTFVPDAVLYYRFRSSLPKIFHQARNGGVASARLYARYRAEGDRPRLIRAEGLKAARAYWGYLRARSIGERAAHLHRLGAVVGFVEGSIRTRVSYLRWRLPDA